MASMTPIPITLGVGSADHQVGQVAFSTSHDQPDADVLVMRVHTRIEFDPAFAEFVAGNVAPSSVGT